MSKPLLTPFAKFTCRGRLTNSRACSSRKTTRRWLPRRPVTVHVGFPVQLAPPSTRLPCPEAAVSIRRTMPLPLDETTRTRRTRTTRGRGLVALRALLARLMVVCVLAGVSEPLIADSCDSPSDTLGAQLSSSEPDSPTPSGGETTHGVHLCHCAHTHAGVPRHPAAMTPLTSEAGRIQAAPGDLRSGPPAQPLLRPPLVA